MTYCEFCGDQIGYLPFTCKYCGGTFCKKHRLPENHECTFELKHVPVVPTSSSENQQRYQDVVLRKPTSREYGEKSPKALKKYLKKQEKQSKKAIRGYQTYQKPYVTTTQYLGTKILFGMIFIFSIIGLFFYDIPYYIYLSLYGLIYKYAFHTIFTSLFISSGDIFGLFFLIIMMFFLYFMARNIEQSYGTKFLVKLYIISSLFSALFYILLRLSLSFYFPIEDYVISVGLAWGGILGILSYSIFPVMNREITALMYFLPIRMKGRSFLILIILIRLIPGLLFSIFSPVYMIIYLPELGGILGAYLIYRYQYGKSKNHY